MDIVEWLRGLAKRNDTAFGKNANGHRYTEAADEIERLRAELADRPHHQVAIPTSFNETPTQR